MKLDVTAELDGYMADAAISVPVGIATPAAVALVRAAERALSRALRVVQPGRRVNEIGQAVEREVENAGFKVLTALGGHGIGRTIHEEPHIANYYDANDRTVLTDGLVITIEPIIAVSTRRVRGPADDGWTISTADASLSAHVEHTIVVRHGGPEILTAAR